MKKRLRKKLHVAEFTLFGFELCVIPASEDPELRDELCRGLMSLIDARHWECLGFSLDCLFLYEGKPNQGLPAGKEAFLAEVSALPNVADVHAEPTVDAWKALNGECDDDDCGCHGHE